MKNRKFQREKYRVQSNVPSDVFERRHTKRPFRIVPHEVITSRRLHKWKDVIVGN